MNSLSGRLAPQYKLEYLNMSLADTNKLSRDNHFRLVIIES